MRTISQLAIRLFVAAALLSSAGSIGLAQDVSVTPAGDSPPRQEVDELKAAFDRSMKEFDRLGGVLTNARDVLQAADSFTSSLSHAEATTESLRQQCAGFDQHLRETPTELQNLVAPQAVHCRENLALVERTLAGAYRKLEEIVARVEDMKKLMSAVEAGMGTEKSNADMLRTSIDLVSSMQNWDRRLERVSRAPGS